MYSVLVAFVMMYTWYRAMSSAVWRLGFLDFARNDTGLGVGAKGVAPVHGAVFQDEEGLFRHD